MPAKTPVRPKHLPRRTCVGCGAVAAKRDLVRVVRTPDGEVAPDPTGKRAGRGAYLCSNSQCWELSVKRGKLERSLHTKLTVQDVERLRSFGQELGAVKEEPR